MTSSFSTLVLETESLTGSLESTDSATLVSQQIPGIQFLLLQYRDCRPMPLHMAFQHGFWGSELRSPCLHSKKFTNWAIFSATENKPNTEKATMSLRQLRDAVVPDQVNLFKHPVWVTPETTQGIGCLFKKKKKKLTLRRKILSWINNNSICKVPSLGHFIIASKPDQSGNPWQGSSGHNHRLFHSCPSSLNVDLRLSYVSSCGWIALELSYPVYSILSPATGLVTSPQAHVILSFSIRVTLFWWLTLSQNPSPCQNSHLLFPD